MFWNKFVLSGYVQEGVLNNNFQAHTFYACHLYVEQIEHLKSDSH